MGILGKAILLASSIAVGQSGNSPDPGQGPAIPVAALVKQQFGPAFAPSTALPKAVLLADFDGDGIEDIVIVADSSDPLPDSYQYKYQVGDPYNSFFGLGDPRQTAALSHYDPGHAHDLLVIFGNGPQAWRAATPKAKFVLINVPFDTIELGRLLIKKNKPPIFVIKVQEARLMESNILFDVKKKKWRWQPGDTLE